MLLLSRNAVLSLIGLSLILHSAEEYLTFPSFLASIGTRLPAWFPAAKLHASQVLPFALLLATVLPLLVSVAAILTRRKPLLVAVLFIEAVLLVNAVSHMLTALLLRSYVPGLVTAVLINLPFGIYVLRRAVKEDWIRTTVAWQLVGAAVLVHIVWLSSVLLQAG